MTTSAPLDQRAKVTILSDTEVLIERVFNAKPALVFEATTTPALLRRWYGCDFGEMASCEIDLRVGGGFKWSMRTPDGQELWWKGEYREIDAPHSIVSTEQFLLGDTWTEALVAHARFEERDGKTMFTNKLVYPSKEVRDGHLGSGMEQGMQLSLANLDRLVVELAAG